MIAIVSLVLCLPGNRANAADGTPLWTNYFNGTGNGHDGITAMALDASGSVYVTGYSEGNGTGQDYATIKYSGSGTALWVNRFNGPGNNYDYPQALAVDGSGNAYVAGTTYNANAGAYNYATIKYTTAGTPVWTNFYSSAGDKQDQATSVAVDSSSNVVVSGVSGYSSGSSEGYEFATIKYSPVGQALWTNRFHVNNSTFERASLGLDASGNVYVSGSAIHGQLGDGFGFDYATVKYSPAGIPLWTNIYSPGGYPKIWIQTLKVDGAGNVYVTGSSYNIDTGQDYATLKYSTDGIPLWTNIYNGPVDRDDYNPVVALDNSGNVIVTGHSFGQGSADDFATIKYSSNGTALWTNRFNGLANSFDGADDVAVDDSDNAYVTGFSQKDQAGNLDNVTVKYSAAGEAVWTNVFNAQAYSFTDFPALVAVDPSGNVYMAGSVYDDDFQANFLVIKYSGPPPPYPPLKIARTGNSVSLSWVTPETGLVLQQAGSLDSSTVWNDTTNLVSVMGQTNSMQQTIGTTNRFFRLRRP